MAEMEVSQTGLNSNGQTQSQKDELDSDIRDQIQNSIDNIATSKVTDYNQVSPQAMAPKLISEGVISTNLANSSVNNISGPVRNEDELLFANMINS